ncbi:TetR/AcrR family transcriptional regulator [Actinomadura sp. WMMB 499]|uniref:TetR/AcrR family transcriptional regulator n=1 Tax=Actinomadura sp. WMMB 499 TaxID=1219491 RepID=UPI00124506F3|nr:helix-turn-helix domain-containing protein [Actinomadura sp. WMMB 499]QFG24670.1 helix-turn-helix transcriptional regulator [Actinomadura sp. WMMB 499]
MMRAREKILNAAARLFAERGLGVSLREIAVEAAQRNHSAVQYHFGDKSGLVDALYEFRMTPLNLRRRELLAELRVSGREGDLPALVECFVGPLSEHVLDHRGESWYLRFSSRYVLSGGYRHWPFSSDHHSGVNELVPLLHARLPDLTGERLRVVFLHTVMVLADVEQRFGDPGFGRGEAAAAAADLRVTATALLTAG